MDIESIERTDPYWKPLWTLFGAYLNQDMSDEYTDVWAAVTAYRVDTGPTRAASASLSARGLSRAAHNEDDARRAVERLGLEYEPTYDGYTYRGWLLELADFLETKR